MYHQPMLCPRCAMELQTVQAAPRPGAPTLSVDTCGRCSGLWLDGAELAPSSPALGGLPYRMSEILQTAAPGDFPCPRCRGLMLSFDLLDVPIDLCRDCQGVWLDGGEFAELSSREDAPRPQRPPRPALPKEVTCRGCGAVTPLDATYYSDRGLVCAECHGTTDSLEAVDGRSEDARRAYAAYAAEQGAIMSQNRAPAPRTSDRTLQQDLVDLRSEIRDLRRKIH